MTIAATRLILTLLICLALTACSQHATPAPSPQPINKDFTITSTWNYDFTNFAKCSTTVTKGCISGFQWGYLSGTTQTQLHTSATSVCSGTKEPETCTDVTNSQLPMGNVGFYLITTFVDNNGAAGTTGVATSPTIPITAGIATNFTVTAQ